MLGKDVIISITSECYKTHVFTQPVVMFPRWWEQYSIDQQPELPSPWAHCLWPTMLSEPGLCAAVHLYLSGDWHQLVIHGEFCIQYFLGDFSSDQNNTAFLTRTMLHFVLCKAVKTRGILHCATEMSRKKGQKAAWQILHAKPRGLCLQRGVRLNHGLGKHKLDPNHM